MDEPGGADFEPEVSSQRQSSPGSRKQGAGTAASAKPQQVARAPVRQSQTPSRQRQQAPQQKQPIKVQKQQVQQVQQQTRPQQMQQFSSMQMSGPLQNNRCRPASAGPISVPRVASLVGVPKTNKPILMPDDFPFKPEINESSRQMISVSYPKARYDGVAHLSISGLNIHFYYVASTEQHALEWIFCGTCQ